MNPSQQMGVIANRSNVAHFAPLNTIHQVTQALAAQSVAVVAGKPKDQSVQIPKRGEPGFGAEDQKKDEEETPVYTKKGKKSKGSSGNLDLVA